MQSWFPVSRKGLIASVVVSGYGFGSSIWSPVQTFYVNPDNVLPQSDSCGSKDRYFVDEDVLSRVPDMFLVLGSIYAAIGIFAGLTITESKKEVKRRHQCMEERSVSIHPLKVLKEAWFYQVIFERKIVFNNVL